MRLTMFFSFPAHFLKICKDWPACSIPGVANTTCKYTHHYFIYSLFKYADTLKHKHRTHHGPRIISVGAIESLDVLKFKHVSLYKGFSDLLIGPRDEKLVVMIRFLCQPRGEVDGGLEVHPLPVWWWEEVIRCLSNEKVHIPSLTPTSLTKWIQLF